MTDKTAHTNVDNPVTHHEESDVNMRAILGFGAALIVVALVVHVVVWVLYMFLAGQETRAQAPRVYPLAVEQEDRLPPEPRLQTSPREDLRSLRTQEDAILNSYGWVDRNKGVVRIPIRDAMRLTLERGLPARAPEQAQAAASASAGGTQPDANSGQSTQGKAETRK